MRGIKKCFGLPQVSVEEAQAIIYHLVDEQDGYFKGLNHEPVTLFGRKLTAIDIQNCFCETDKYARVAHPEFNDPEKNERIKQKFEASGPLPAPYFPPKWGLKVVL